MFTLDQVRCFVAVAQELHFGRAAERLNMTQPPLSRQIQKLERSMRVQLLERTPRNVVLTAAGEVFLRASIELLDLADQAPQSALSVAQGYEGSIQLGITVGAAVSVLGDILKRTSESLPKVHLELLEMVTGDQVDSLRSGKIDLGIVRPAFDPVEFHSQILITEDLVLAVPSESDWGRDGAVVTSKELKRAPVIMQSPKQARYFYDLILRKFEIDHNNITHVVTQAVTMLALVSEGRGVAFLPASSQALTVEGVRYVSLDESGKDVVELHAIWNPSNSNPALWRLLSALK